MKPIVLLLLSLILCGGGHAEADDNTPTQTSDPLPLRLGIVGLSHDHVKGLIWRHFDRDDVKIVGVAESNQDLSKRYSEEFQLSREILFTDIDTMLERARPEAVVVFAPTVDHADIVEKCAANGIDVMLEKKLAIDSAHAKRIHAAVKQSGIHLLVNYETSWHTCYHEAHSLVRGQRAIGALRKIVVHAGHSGPDAVGVSEDFREWLLDPKASGGGALVDFGCYGAALVTWLMNGEAPTSVTAVTQQIRPDKHPDVEDEATLILKYPGLHAIIQASWNWPEQRFDMEVYGEEGQALTMWDNRVRLKLADQREKLVIGKPLPRNANSPYTYLVSVVRGSAEVHPLSSLPINLVVVEILDAARQSAATGKTVVLPH